MKLRFFSIHIHPRETASRCRYILDFTFNQDLKESLDEEIKNRIFVMVDSKIEEIAFQTEIDNYLNDLNSAVCLSVNQI